MGQRDRTKGPVSPRGARPSPARRARSGTSPPGPKTTTTRQDPRRSSAEAEDISETPDGRTPLHDAALDDDTDALLALLSGGADPDTADLDGAVPLHYAATTGALGAIQVLLAAGATPDLADSRGNTPLMTAITTSNDDPQLAQALTAAGADPYARNNFGQTPARMAGLLGHHRLLAGL